MKPFQNPYIVGGLAVLALGLVCRNAIAPLWGRMVHHSLAVPVQTEAAAPLAPPVDTPVGKIPPAEAPTPKAPRLEPERNIDLAQVGWNWHSSPHRDPFQITPATITNLARLYPPAADLLSLTAVWRQTGSSLALINGRILGDGDTILALFKAKAASETNATYRYKIESIEGDSVWVEGPAGREQVEFRAIGSVSPGGSTTGKLDVKGGGTAMK